MLPNSWIEAEMARQIHENDVEQAANARLIALTDDAQPQTLGRLRQIVGGWLIAAGQRLQPPMPLHKVHLHGAHELQ